MIKNGPQKPAESELPFEENNDPAASQSGPDESEIATVPEPRDEFEYQRRLFFGR